MTVATLLSVCAPGCYRRGSADIYELTAQPTGAPPYVAGYTVLMTNDRDALARFGLTRVACIRRVAFGDLCFVAAYNGEIVSTLWAHPGSYYVRGMGYERRAPQDHWYLYGAQTAPDHRRKGLFTALVALASQQLRARSTGAITAMVTSNNAISRRVFVGLGYEVAAHIEHRTWGWIKWTTVMDDWGTERRVFIREPERYSI